MSKRSKDTWLYFSACTTGTALLCMMLTSWSTSTRTMIGIAGVGLALVGLSQWRTKSRGIRPRETVVDRASVVVDAESRAEIVFCPPLGVKDPRLVLSAHGRPVCVEDVWRGDVSVLWESKSITHWRSGVPYHGVVDAKRPLKILLHNRGFSPAIVHAKLVIPETAADK